MVMMIIIFVLMYPEVQEQQQQKGVKIECKRSKIDCIQVWNRIEQKKDHAYTHTHNNQMNDCNKCRRSTLQKDLRNDA